MWPTANVVNRIACPTGTYSEGEANIWQPWPAGYSWTATTKTPWIVGKFSLIGQGVWTTCPAAKYCPLVNLDLILDWPPGTYSNGGLNICLLWPAGKNWQLR